MILSAILTFALGFLAGAYVYVYWSELKDLRDLREKRDE